MRNVNGRLVSTCILTAFAIAVTVALSACGSQANPKASVSPGVRNGEIKAAMTQCLIRNGSIPKKDIADFTWYRNGKVDAGSAKFYTWATAHELRTYGNKHLEDWFDSAIGKWPQQMCGPAPTITPLSDASS